jgi:hypothetical protein
MAKSIQEMYDLNEGADTVLEANGMEHAMRQGSMFSKREAHLFRQD